MEKDVAAKLKAKNTDILWKATSDKYGVGTPDRAAILRGTGEVFWVELKFLRALPKKRCKVGLKPKQAAWLQEWKENGGDAFLIVGVGSDKVSVFEDGFKSIAFDGVSREDFNLINYEQVTSVLRSRLWQ